MKNRYETVSDASYSKLKDKNRVHDNRVNLEEIEDLKRTILRKDNEIDELRELIVAKEKEVTTNSQKLKVAEEKFNKLKLYAIKEKKEKIKVQEALLKSYEKEEKLLKAHQTLLNIKEDQLTIAKREKVQVQEKLLQSYEKEELLLKSYRALLKKYNALSQSKFGKLTLAYWSKRNGIKKRLGK